MCKTVPQPPIPQERKPISTNRAIDMKRLNVMLEEIGLMSWAIDEFNSGNRKKASRIFKVGERFQRRRRMNRR